MTTVEMNMGSDGAARGRRLRIIGWSLAAALLALPFIAMQFTSEVQWDETDFIAFGIMLTIAAGLWDLATRMRGGLFYRGGAALAVIAGFLTIWANLAVGMIGSEDNSFNLIFMGVVALSLIGAGLVRFRAAGMAWVMLAAAAVQLGGSVVGWFSDPRGGVFSAFFAGFWFLSSILFRIAAEPSRNAP